MTPDERALLLYDATCRFCEVSSRRVVRLLPTGSVGRRDVNDPRSQQRYGITREDAQREMYVVNGRGELSHGAGAVRELLKLSRWVWPLAWLWYIPGFSYLAQKIYLWIAAHRYLIMGRARSVEAPTEPDRGCENNACSVHLGRLNTQRDKGD